MLIKSDKGQLNFSGLLDSEIPLGTLNWQWAKLRYIGYAANVSSHYCFLQHGAHILLLQLLW